MRISTTYGFAFLCMPKTASTSIETALFPYCDLVTKNKQPNLKHTNYRTYSRFIEPYLKKTVGKKLETICVMRDPIDWLHSWYRYRKRDALKGKDNSTENMDFSEFISKYILGEIRVGKQSNFITDRHGNIGVDRVFKYEDLDKLKEYFENKIGKRIELPVMNVSPKEEFLLDEELKFKLRDYLEIDYNIYNGL